MDNSYMVEEVKALREKAKELEEQHQDDCITINQLQTTVDVLIDRYAQLRRNMGLT